MKGTMSSTVAVICDSFKHNLEPVLRTAQVILSGSFKHSKPPGVVPHVPNCRPFDFSFPFRPNNLSSSQDHPPCPFSELDVTTIVSKGYRSPLHSACPSQLAIAIAKHLCDKMKGKLCDKV
jgi:hypothetical protein